MTKSVNNLLEYRKAKILAQDLESILRVINLSISALHHYSKYAPVNLIISTLQTNKTLLEIHYNKYKRIVETKGKVDKIE
jgi:hypothetical protein